MQPINDDELQRLLREWRAPSAPPSLEMRVLAAAEPAALRRLLRWLTTGSIRVPVPVGFAVALLLLSLAFNALQARKPDDGKCAVLMSESAARVRSACTADRSWKGRRV
jgi:hypothetical protein